MPASGCQQSPDSAFLTNREDARAVDLEHAVPLCYSTIFALHPGIAV
jgi:hypothetical protein